VDWECATIWFIINVVGCLMSVNYLLYTTKYPLLLALLSKYFFSRWSPYLDFSCCSWYAVRCEALHGVSKLANSVKQSCSWEAYPFPSSPEISYIMGNPKIHYFVQNIPSSGLILSRSNPFHAIPLHIFRCTLILFSHRRLDFPTCSFPSGFPCQQPAYISLIRLTVEVYN
jgi:hypothetical protein